MEQAKLLYNLKWRRITGRNSAGVWFILNRTATPKSISDFVKRFSLVDVYASSACYLNPFSHRPRQKQFKKGKGMKFKRAGYKALFLSCDFVIDIDVCKPEDAKYGLYFLNEFRKYKPYLIVKTNKGWHLWFRVIAPKIENVSHREAWHIHFFRDIVKHLRTKHDFNDKFKEVVDFQWCSNTRHVFRVPGSTHNKGSKMLPIYADKHAIMNLKDIITRVHLWDVNKGMAKEHLPTQDKVNELPKPNELYPSELEFKEGSHTPGYAGSGALLSAFPLTCHK